MLSVRLGAPALGEFLVVRPSAPVERPAYLVLAHFRRGGHQAAKVAAEHPALQQGAKVLLVDSPDPWGVKLAGVPTFAELALRELAMYDVPNEQIEVVAAAGNSTNDAADTIADVVGDRPALVLAPHFRSRSMHIALRNAGAAERIQVAALSAESGRPPGRWWASISDVKSVLQEYLRVIHLLAYPGYRGEPITWSPDQYEQQLREQLSTAE